MDFLHIDQQQLTVFLLAGFRLAGLFVVAPLFGGQSIAMPLKAGACLFIALLIAPGLRAGQVPAPQGLLHLAGMIAQEVAVGLLIGYAANMVFWGLQAAGEIVGREMGLNIAETFDPVLETPLPVVGQLKVFFATLVFLCLDGHHWLLQALIASFRAVPMAGLTLKAPVFTALVGMSSQIFVIAIKISAPVFVALFLVTAMMGIVERMIPQMHMFTMGFPLKIGLGLVMLSLSVPFLVYMFHRFFLGMNRDISTLIAAMM